MKVLVPFAPELELVGRVALGLSVLVERSRSSARKKDSSAHPQFWISIKVRFGSVSGPETR